MNVPTVSSISRRKIAIKNYYDNLTGRKQAQVLFNLGIIDFIPKVSFTNTFDREALLFSVNINKLEEAINKYLK